MHFTKIFNPRFVYISPLALIAVSACRSPYQATSEVTGNIVKGPLSNALVFLDLNGNNVLDTNEQSVRTDADGKFSFNKLGTAPYKIVALTDDSTVDASSGSVLAGVTLTAPQGAAVVTPATTLMEEGGLTALEIAEVLNLPDGVDPLTFNPFAEGVDAAKALEVEKISQQIITAVNSFASAAEGAGASEKGAFTAALNSVVDVVKVKAEKITDPNAVAADKKIDFSNTTDLNLIRDKVADEAEKVVKAEGTAGFNKATLTSLVADTAVSVKNVNDQIDSVTDLTSNATKGVFSTLQVLTDQIKAAAVAEKAAPGSGSIEFTDAAKVATATANLAPTKVILTTDSVSQVGTTLLLGTLNTTDSDQPDGVAFTYSIAETDGTDHSLFSINQSTGALSLQEIPDFKSPKTYTVIIQSKDNGGKVTGKMYEIVILTNGDDDVTLSEVSELVLAMDGNDTINAGAGDDIVLGGSGNDTIDAGAGDDKIYGGAGDDTIIQSGSGTQHYDGGEGTDTYKLNTVAFGNVDFDIKVDLTTGFSGLKDNPTHALNDTLTNIENVDFSDVSWDLVLNGDAKANILKGGSGNDVIQGNAGSDTIDAGAGDDKIYGGAGDDTIIQSGSGTQHYDGGEGTDTYKLNTVAFGNVDFDIKVDLTTGFSGLKDNPTHALNDTLTNIENVDFSDVSWDLVLNGDAKANILKGGSGNDVLQGHAGNDTINGGAGDDTIINGSGYDYDYSGGGGVDTYDGGDGIDTLISGMIGGSWYGEYIDEINLKTGSAGGKGSDFNRDTIKNIENVTYVGTLNAEITGDDKDNVLIGSTGDDTIDGGAGDDKIYGGAGDDTIIQSGSGTQHYDGGEGTDTYKLNTAAFGNVDFDIKVDLTTGFSGLKDNPTHALNDTLTNIENVDFSDVSWDLVLNGDAKANVLKGGTGDDKIYGGIGDDVLAGGGGSDVVEAGAGNDVVIHMANTVAADGGEGNDTFFVDIADKSYAAIISERNVSVEMDFVAETHRAFNATTGEYFGTGDDTVRNFENFKLSGDISAKVFGDANANNIITDNGDDLIDGGLGADKISTGNGSDTVVIRQGDGGNTIAEADIISDFSDGSDLIGLNNLNYSDLTIEQGSGDYVNDALISKGTEYLVVIEDIDIADLTEADFVAYEIV